MKGIRRFLSMPLPLRNHRGAPDILPVTADSFGRIGDVSIVIDDEDGHRVIPIHVNLYRLPE